MKKIRIMQFFVCLFFFVASLPCFASLAQIEWTLEEKEFLQTHPVIRLGVDPGFAPFEYIDEAGEYEGLAADYLNLISEATGLRFEPVLGLTWPQAYELAMTGDIDVLPAVGKTPEREQHFLLTRAYYHFKRVIVTQDTNSWITGMDDLEGRTVAVQRHSSQHSYLQAFPKINLSLYETVDSALAAVATGEELAFLGNLATTNYLIRSHGMTNLRFVAFEAESQQSLHIAVRKDWPVLAGILDKAMGSIPEEEQLAISRKWINIEAEVDYTQIIRIVLMSGALVLIILGVSFFWIIRLRTEVRQRKAIQVDLEKAKQEAVEANEFKSSFMARMSHEIRTPLNAITGMAYLMKKTKLTLTQQMYADRITQASSNMLGIINDILDFSKIEAGKVELEVTSFSLDQVIQDVVNIVSYKIEEQGIGLRLSKDPLVPNWFFGDSKRIEQILLNLLNNAVKFTSKGEVSMDIRLKAKEGSVHHLTFTIKDTGIGMTGEQVKRLFSPFLQADNSITRRFGGSGLGLSIVKNLLDLMGGQVQVFSTPGEGSTFIVQLSLPVDKDKEDVYIKTLAGEHFKQVRTLVLEKTGANMNLIESYLGSFGMHCELTTSQASAKSMLESADGNFAKPFDLLILDFETPTEGGFNFVRSITNNAKIVKKPKIIMLLPMLREDLFDKLEEHGIDFGIGKPIIPSILFNGILDLFNLKAVSASQPIEGQSVMESDQGPNSSGCVLVAEDNKTNQLIARSLLQQANIASIIASDGQNAVELFKKNQETVALVLMDLHMPVMNGYDAAREIRTLDPNIPIVAMTADVILGVKEKCAECGIHHYLSKPYDPDQFLSTVRNLMQKPPTISNGAPLLDIPRGLKNLGEDNELYRQVLAEYAQENRHILEDLTSLIRDKQYIEAARVIHKAKGSSGSIGAKKIYELAIELQKVLELQQEPEIRVLYEDFHGTFKRLLAEITGYLATQDHPK